MGWALFYVAGRGAGRASRGDAQLAFGPTKHDGVSLTEGLIFFISACQDASPFAVRFLGITKVGIYSLD